MLQLLMGWQKFKLLNYIRLTPVWKYAMFSQMHVVFDTYVENSLKAATRCIQQHGTVPKEYKINNSTNIKSVPLKKLLGHV